MQDPVSQLDQRQTRVPSLPGLLKRHPMAESDLVSKLDRLIAALDEKHPLQPDALGTLCERLAASLQTAMSVQLAPLSDDLPDRLAEVVASTAKSNAGGPPFTLPELVRELEKFQTHSMASLAARMTAGLQTVMSSQLGSFAEELPQRIVAAITAATPEITPVAAPTPPRRSSSPFSDPDPSEEAEVMAQELERVRKELAETEALLSEALEQGVTTPPPVAASAEMNARLSAAEADRDRLQLALEENQAELTRVQSEAEIRSNDQEQSHSLVESLRREIGELRELLALKESESEQAEELRLEIARLRENAAMGDTLHQAASSADEEELRDRLDRATFEIVSLRNQNEELAEQIAHLQVSAAPHGAKPLLANEGMSWEERKRLLLQQLDAEQEDNTPHSHAKRVEINDILRTTEAELARRDREIAELRSLIEQQSDAREGMAVGAAAVAQLIESDELVQQEREKLRAIQKSWDEKFRQAEIDLSMERAKLARERSQLEEQKHKLEQALQLANAAAADVDHSGRPTDARGRKWLSRLGLKEEG